MNTQVQLVSQLRRSLGDLGAVEAKLRGTGARALLERTVRERAVVVPPIRVAGGQQRSALDMKAAEQLLAVGRQGLHKLQQQGDEANLSPEELLGLEATVLVIGRPALFVAGGDFTLPPEPWGPLLKQERARIRDVFQRVGRIELSFGGGAPEPVGTGFLVAPDVVMTNRHVVKAFSSLDQGTWRFMPGMAPRIDYLGEQDPTQQAAFRLTGLLGVHDSPDVDLALLRVSWQAEHALPAPTPLTLASQPPDAPAGLDVYVVGYPAKDNQGLTPPEVLRDIFGSEYAVKRLQPGKLLEVDATRPVFTHDCSTLGGNSGSCVVDLKTQLVIGLHFGGGYRQSNYAVALWQLRDDPLLRSAGVQFDPA